jgi:hypothetical protein
MKTAIYIEDGRLQVVITPESEFDKKALSTLENRPLEAQIFSGSFYDCRGGWVRQSAYQANYSGGDRSLIVRIAEPPPSSDQAIAKLDEMIAAGEPRPDIE